MQRSEISVYQLEVHAQQIYVIALYFGFAATLWSTALVVKKF